jgi:A/G-specific adenine glycosylase
LTQKDAQSAADRALVPGESWSWNQCLMELGATLCRPTSPQCDVCPLNARCAWRGSGDDPAAGSAGVSKAQPRFDGSDRQARGRLMKALVAGPVPVDRVPAVMGCDLVRANRLAADLRREGLVIADRIALRLP